MNYTLILPIVAIFLLSCNSNNENTRTSPIAIADTSSMVVDIVPSTNSKSNIASPTLNVPSPYIYTGILASNIQIEASLKIKGNAIDGLYKYKKQKASLTIKGTINNYKVVLKEFDSNGNNTGTFTGTMSNDSTIISGEWKNESKTFPFKLNRWNGMYFKESVVIENKSIKLCDCENTDADIPVVKSDKLPFYVLDKINSLTFNTDISEGESCDCDENGNAMGTIGGSYDITNNQNGILSIRYTSEGMGAYPSSYTELINIHLGDGRRISIKEIFKEQSISEINSFLEKSLQEKLTQTINDMEEPEYKDEIRQEAEIRLQSAPLIDYTNFFIDANKLTLSFEWGFPRIMLAYEPEKSIPLSQEKVNQWVNPEGPLAYLIK